MAKIVFVQNVIICSSYKMGNVGMLGAKKQITINARNVKRDTNSMTIRTARYRTVVNIKMENA
jgi:hypothetical protein